MKTTALLKQTVSFLLILIIPAICAGKTIYVSPSGNDANNGNIQHPFKTIRYAIEKMNNNDTCMVRKGIYREEIVIDKNGITLCAY